LEIQPGGDEASNEGCNSGPTGKGFTDNSIYKALNRFRETITWKELNAVKISFSFDFNKNATATCSRPFTDDCWLYKGHFRPPKMTGQQSMTQVRMSKP